MFKKIILSILIIFAVTGCNKTFVSKSGFWMGTIVEITFDVDKSNIVDEGLKYLKTLEDKIALFTNDINIKGEAKVDEDIKYLISKNEYYKKISNGRFDMAVGTIGYLYGFPEGPYEIPDIDEISKSLEKVHKNRFEIINGYIKRSEEVKIDMGAYAKGYIVDKVSEYFRRNGLKNFILNAGGDLYASGNKNGKKWKIAIKNSESEKKYLSAIELSDMAVATSGNYERYFEINGKRYIHIFDALTGENANNYQSISVIADNVEKADGFATVYFLMSVDEISRICKNEGTPVLVYTLDNKLLKFCGWEDFEIN